MRYSLPLISIATAAATACVAQGAVVAADDFESYTAGQQLETATTRLNGGTGFSGAYNIDDTFRAGAKVSGTSLSYTSGALSVDGGNNALAITGDATVVNRFLYRQFPSQTGTLYFSFLYRTTNAANEEDFIQIGLANSVVDEPPISVGTGQGLDTPPNVNPFFVRMPTGTGSNKLSSTYLQPGTTYFLVGKIAKTASGNYDNIKLFLNPSTLTEPTPLLERNANSNLAAVSQFAIRIARLDANETYFLDNLQIGTSFTEVVPEPGALSLLASASLLLVSRRRSTQR